MINFQHRVGQHVRVYRIFNRNNIAIRHLGKNSLLNTPLVRFEIHSELQESFSVIIHELSIRITTTDMTPRIYDQQDIQFCLRL
jgi:hypothetical protein